MTPFTPADLVVGDPIPTRTEPPLSLTDFVRYQGASGDMNPIHHDQEFARAAGFPGVFAIGMLPAGILGTYVADLFGPAAIRRFKVQFREQAWPGDELLYAGHVSARTTDAEGALIDLELTTTRPTGGVHLLGWATVRV